jgi:hypothetical protein
VLLRAGAAPPRRTSAKDCLTSTVCILKARAALLPVLVCAVCAVCACYLTRIAHAPSFRLQNQFPVFVDDFVQLGVALGLTSVSNMKSKQASMNEEFRAGNTRLGAPALRAMITNDVFMQQFREQSPGACAPSCTSPTPSGSHSHTPVGVGCSSVPQRCRGSLCFWLHSRPPLRCSALPLACLLLGAAIQHVAPQADQDARSWL